MQCCEIRHPFFHYHGKVFTQKKNGRRGKKDVPKEKNRLPFQKREFSYCKSFFCHSSSSTIRYLMLIECCHLPIHKKLTLSWILCLRAAQGNRRYLLLYFEFPVSENGAIIHFLECWLALICMPYTKNWLCTVGF